MINDVNVASRSVTFDVNIFGFLDTENFILGDIAFDESNRAFC